MREQPRSLDGRVLFQHTGHRHDGKRGRTIEGDPSCNAYHAQQAEMARLRAELKTSKEIQLAEKEILIAEVARNKQLRDALKECVPYVERALERNLDGLKDADPESQFYGEDVCSGPILVRARKALENKGASN